MGDTLVVVECKNVSSIDGTLDDNFWRMTGARSIQENSYTALNVCVQNRIHVKALKSAFISQLGMCPFVESYIVVPNNCSIPEELQGHVQPVSLFFENLFIKHRTTPSPNLRLKLLELMQPKEDGSNWIPTSRLRIGS